ncbi:MAG TPA: cytotoxin [Desulfobulbaceae bacterium]|nr:cytotoxin [Desulfobulbaceae bacterium]
MRYQAKVTATANEAGKQLAPEIRAAAKEALRRLCDNPFLGKRLREELQGFWTYRFNRYRIIYTIDVEKKWLIIQSIGHRRDIYERFNQLLLDR